LLKLGPNLPTLLPMRYQPLELLGHTVTTSSPSPGAMAAMLS